MLTVAFVDGGQAGNVIPESVRFGGTFRFMTLEGYSYLKQRIKEVQLKLSRDYVPPQVLELLSNCSFNKFI